MFSRLKVLGAMCAAGILTACTGTGTTDPTQVNTLIREADGNTAIVVRNTGFAGSAARIAVFLDGEQVAFLGSNEVGTFQASPGKHTLSLEFEGIDIGTKTNELIYDNDPTKPQYFAINLEQELFGANMTINEVPAELFLEQVR